MLPSFKNIIDLTVPLNERVAGFSKRPARDLEADGWNASWLEVYSHAGTHMDAPFHFGVSQKTIDEYAPEAFMGSAWVVDISITEDQQLLTIADLGSVAERFQFGESLILRTGWSVHLGTPRFRDGLPRIGRELAQWCVDKRVKLLGVEPPSVADVNNLPEVTEIHEILLRAEVMIVEGLVNLEKIPVEKVFFMALPLKIADGDGAPVRALAFY